MANLIVDSANWGGVERSDPQPSFPCMDSNYREFTWTFEVLKQFADFETMIGFEQDTIPTYFSDREKNVTYAGESENNCLLQSFRRKELLSPGTGNSDTTALYEIVFTKEG